MMVCSAIVPSALRRKVWQWSETLYISTRPVFAAYRLHIQVVQERICHERTTWVLRIWVNACPQVRILDLLTRNGCTMS